MLSESGLRTLSLSDSACLSHLALSAREWTRNTQTRPREYERQDFTFCSYIQYGAKCFCFDYRDSTDNTMIPDHSVAKRCLE